MWGKNNKYAYFGTPSNMACVVPSDSSDLQVRFLIGISSYPINQSLFHLQGNARVTQHWRKLQ